MHVLEEHGLADSARDNSFASEQELQELASAWPMKRLIEIWNHLPGVEPVTRFTDRKTAIRRIWRALQPQAEEPGKALRRTKAAQRPVFREGSKAAQVCIRLESRDRFFGSLISVHHGEAFIGEVPLKLDSLSELLSFG